MRGETQQDKVLYLSHNFPRLDETGKGYLAALIQALLMVQEIIVKQDFVPSYEGTII
jgi:hypothetical protein